jgi:hypothetical protein
MVSISTYDSISKLSEQASSLSILILIKLANIFKVVIEIT